MTGFLTRTLARVRMFANEPAVNAKFSNDALIDLITSMYMEVFGELVRLSAHPITVTYDIVPQSDQMEYDLPMLMGSVELIECVNSNGDRLWIIEPRSRLSLTGEGFRIENRTLIFTGTQPPVGHTFRIHYIPVACPCLHEGAITPSTDIATVSNRHVVTLSATPTLGTLDTRQNSYAGCTLKLLNAPEQSHEISSFDSVTRKATLRTKLDPVPTGVSVAYEIAPPINEVMDMAVAVGVAKTVVAMEGNTTAMSTLTQLYNEKMREIRLFAANMDSYKGGRLSPSAYMNRRIPWGVLIR